RRNGARVSPRQRRAASGGFVLRRRFFRHRTGGRGRIVRRRGIRPACHQGGTTQRADAKDQQRRVHGVGGGGGFAGIAEKVFAGTNGVSARAAAQRLFAGGVEIVAGNKAG